MQNPANPVYRVLLIIRLLIATLVLAGSCVGQDESTVTAEEKAQVTKFARHFVEELLKTRDVGRLIPEFFLSDFVALSKQDFYEKVSPELYARLSKNEKVRLFVAQENLGYIITLDVMMQPDSATAATSTPFKQILPVPIAQKLNRSRLVEGTSRFTARKELLKELTALEKSLLAARYFLKRRNLEQTPAFLKKLKSFERDPYVGYRVRSSVIDEELKREFGMGRFATGQKVFSVDTPILIELVLTIDAGKLKILTLVPADGD